MARQRLYGYEDEPDGSGLRIRRSAAETRTWQVDMTRAEQSALDTINVNFKIFGVNARAEFYRQDMQRRRRPFTVTYAYTADTIVANCRRFDRIEEAKRFSDFLIRKMQKVQVGATP